MIRINLCSLAKFFISLFCMYIFWYYGAIGANNILLYSFALLSTVCVLLDIFATKQGKLEIGRQSIVPMYFVFGLYALLTGFFFAIDVSFFFSKMITYFAYIVLCFDIYYVASSEESYDWTLNIMLLAAYLCAFYTIFFGVAIRSSGVYVTTMGINNNPNTLGLIMVMGIFAGIIHKFYAKHYYLSLITVLLFTYVIILSGSRKCFFCGLALIAFWFLVDLSRKIKERRTSVIVQLAVVFALAVFVVNRYGMVFMNSSMFERLQGASIQSSTEDRVGLYQDAINLWKNNPVFGIGFGQFEKSGSHLSHSHSSYAEILSCTGILGIFIWFIGLFQCVRRSMKKYRMQKLGQGFEGIENVYRYCLCLGMLLIELLLGVGQIWIYDFTHLFIFVTLFGLVEYGNRSQTEM